MITITIKGSITQSVEWRTVNPCVAGSIPARPTKSNFKEDWQSLV